MTELGPSWSAKESLLFLKISRIMWLIKFTALFTLWFLYNSGVSSTKKIGGFLFPLSVLGSCFALFSSSFFAESRVARFVDVVALVAGLVLGVPFSFPALVGESAFLFICSLLPRIWIPAFVAISFEEFDISILDKLRWAKSAWTISWASNLASTI